MQISTVVYVPLCYTVVNLLVHSAKIDGKAMEAPKYKFAIIALLDGLTGLFTLFGGVYTAGTTQMLLMQGAIPITMVLSILILKTRVEFMQFAGAAVILAGVFVVMAPKIFATPDRAFVAERSGDVFLFNVIFFLGNIPSGLGNVYKEGAFKQHENLDVWFVMMWTATFQTMLQWMMLPFNSLSFLGDQAIPMNELWSAWVNGARCFVGINTVVHDCYVRDPIFGMQPCDSCGGSWFIICQYLVANIGFNMFSIMLIKEGSAALYIIIMTLRLPLGNIAFYMPWIMGDEAQDFNSHDISGLVVILLGLVLYRIQRAPAEPESDAPYVLTSIVTFIPGVSEPVVNQIHRRDVSLKASSSHIRGQLYTRLGMPPSPSYRAPSETERERTASAPVPVDEEAVLSSQPVRRRSSIYGSKPPTAGSSGRLLARHTAPAGGPMVGVSPIARSSPLYSMLYHRSLSGARLGESESEEEVDEESEQQSNGTPL